MTKAVIELSEHANRIVNIIKARDGLRSKSEAIERILEDFEEQVLDPSLKPDFARHIQNVREGGFEDVENLDELL